MSARVELLLTALRTADPTAWVDYLAAVDFAPTVLRSPDGRYVRDPDRRPDGRYLGPLGDAWILPAYEARERLSWGGAIAGFSLEVPR